MQINDAELKRFILDGGLLTKTALEEVANKAQEKKQKLSLHHIGHFDCVRIPR